MSAPVSESVRLPVVMPSRGVVQEFQHLQAHWRWLSGLGILLMGCGVLALLVPAVTLSASFFAMVALGVSLMVAGIATIVMAFWAGRWSGLLVQLLVGTLYVVVGFVISDSPLASAAMMAAFVAAFFIIVGIFRTLAALVIRFPHWGWALLNGVITLLCGVIIFRHFAENAPWVVGILVGLELLFHGWNWLMLSQAVRRIPVEAIEP